MAFAFWLLRGVGGGWRLVGAVSAACGEDDMTGVKDRN